MYLCRCVPPHGVGVFAPVWSENGYTLCPFCSGIGYGFQGTKECRAYLSFQFQMSEKEREICDFEMDLKNFFVCTLIEVMIT